MNDQESASGNPQEPRDRKAPTVPLSQPTGVGKLDDQSTLTTPPPNTPPTNTPPDGPGVHDSQTLIGDPSAAPPTLTATASAASSATCVRYFGDYELLSEIARGGMGVVFKARQVNLNRVVALKMILAGQLADDMEVKRFHAEAEAAARLDHPGIVPIFEIGEHEGQHYFSMGFVEGESLAKKVANGPLPVWEAAELVRKVAEALQYAHDKGVVHRDLKPANVLLDAQGQPKVTDFGLAKQLQGDSGLTGTGQILGTPSYMPPEQAAGNLEQVGPRSDVYSLGAILYCLVTGRPPFQAASPMDTLMQVLDQEPVSVRQLNGQVPIDLETITLKCLDKEPSRRYATARELAEELQRYLNCEPIVARPISAPARAWRWCRRKPLIAGLLGATALSLIVGTIISSYFAVLAGQRAELAGNETKRANENSDEASLNAADALREATRARENARRADKNADMAITNEKKAEANAANEASARQAAERQLRISTAERLAALSQLKHAASPEISMLLAIESGRTTRIDEEGLLASSHQALLDALAGVGGRPLVGHQGPISSVTISPDSRWIVTGSHDKTARVWNLMAENAVANPRILGGHQGTIESVAISPDSRWIVTGSGDSTARVWDLKAENPAAEPRTLSGHQNAISSVAISPDSRWIVTGSDDTTARIWDLKAKNPAENPRVLSGHQEFIKSVAISPDSRWVVTGSLDNTARIWDLTADDPGANPRVLTGHEGGISSVAISPDGRWVVTGSFDNTARIWDLTAESPAANPRVLSGHQRGIMSVAISSDGRWIITQSDDKTVRIWDRTAEEPSANPRVLRGLTNPMTFSLAVSSDGRWIVTGNPGWYGEVRVWRWQWNDLVTLSGQVGRNFTRDEWKLYVPYERYRKTFPDLPIPGDP